MATNQSTAPSLSLRLVAYSSDARKRVSVAPDRVAVTRTFNREPIEGLMRFGYDLAHGFVICKKGMRGKSQAPQAVR